MPRTRALVRGSLTSGETFKKRIRRAVEKYSELRLAKKLFAHLGLLRQMIHELRHVLDS